MAQHLMGAIIFIKILHLKKRELVRLLGSGLSLMQLGYLYYILVLFTLGNFLKGIDNH